MITEGNAALIAGSLTRRPHAAEDEAHILLIEPMGTPNTGDAGGKLTAGEERICLVGALDTGELVGDLRPAGRRASASGASASPGVTPEIKEDA